MRAKLIKKSLLQNLFNKLLYKHPSWGIAIECFKRFNKVGLVVMGI